MAEERIALIVTELQSDRRDKFEVLVAEFVKQDPEDVLWSALGAAHGVGLNIFERLLAWPAENTRNAMRRLMPAVQHVQSFALTDAVQFLQFANRVPRPFWHSVSEQLRPHLVSEPALGKQVGDALRRGDAVGHGATRIWAEAFANAAPRRAAEYALELLAGSDADLALLAILLQYLPTSNGESTSLLHAEEARLADALVRVVPTVGLDAWFGLTAIAGISPSAMNALKQAAIAGDASAVNALSNWLYTVSTPTVGAIGVPLDELIKVLLQHAVSDSAVRSTVDSGVASLLFRDALRGVVLACVDELKSLDADLAELFPSVFGAVIEKPGDFTKMLTGWLVAEGATFAAIRSLLSRCATGQGPAGLDAQVFAAAPRTRKVAALRRILSLSHNGPVLCLFIASLAETPALQPDGLDLAAQMLNEALTEYPAATEEFLKARTRAAERNQPFALVYRGVYADALRWRRVLARLPQLNELRPAESQLHALRAMQQRLGREIMRQATERSIFAALSTNVHLAQGHRFTTHTAHGTPQISHLRQARHAIELPSSELADPVGGMLRRAKALGTSR